MIYRSGWLPGQQPCCAVQPEKVFSEIFRVLKPGGCCIVTFSNRLFYDKARRQQHKPISCLLPSTPYRLTGVLTTKALRGKEHNYSKLELLLSESASLGQVSFRSAGRHDLHWENQEHLSAASF